MSTLSVNQLTEAISGTILIVLLSKIAVSFFRDVNPDMST